MDRVAAWRQWWLNATISALAMIAVVALNVTDLVQLGWWALAPLTVGVVAVVVGAVVNRSRESPTTFHSPAGPDRRRQ